MEQRKLIVTGRKRLVKKLWDVGHTISVFIPNCNLYIYKFLPNLQWVYMSVDVA